MQRSPPTSIIKTRGALRKDKNVAQKVDEDSVAKSEPRAVPAPQQPPVKSTRSDSKRSSLSIAARKAQLELEAAQAKAKIQVEVIEKQLAADLANLEEQGSIKSASNTHDKVEQWLEHSQHELDVRPAPDQGHNSGVPYPLTSNNVGHEEGTVHLLASALKDLTTASAVNGHNPTMLSRLCTPRDLPLFAGDSMEWLHFKQEYEESSQLCHFSATENLWRLRKCLRGAAREAVSSLLISATTPEMVISTLELQFGNPDIILSRIIMDIKKLPPLSQEYYKDIPSFAVKVRNYVAAVSVIGRNEYLVATNVIVSILNKLPTVLLSKWADYSYPINKEGKKPTLQNLSEFLHEEAVKINTLGLVNTRNIYDTHRYKYQEPTSTRSHRVLVNNEEYVDKKCIYCRMSNHKIPECRKFKRALCKTRWSFIKKNRICFKCLISKHERKTCPADACDVDSCGQQHHRLLHYNVNRNNVTLHTLDATDNRDSNEREITQVQHRSQAQSESVTHLNSQTDCKVLLKVVRVNLHGPNGTLSVYALLDDGSTVSLISADLTSRLGMRGRRDTIRVGGAWNNDELICETEVVQLQMSTCEGQKYELYARSVKKLNLPNQNLYVVNCNTYDHLKNLKFNLCDKNVKPELLIGQDNYNLLIPLECRVGKFNEPCATLTPLGWCIHGRVPVTSFRARDTTLLIRERDVQESQDHDEDKFMLQKLHDQLLKGVGSIRLPRYYQMSVKTSETEDDLSAGALHSVARTASRATPQPPPPTAVLAVSGRAELETVTMEEFEKVAKVTFPYKNEVDIKNLTDVVRKQLKLKINSNVIEMEKLFHENEEGFVHVELARELYRQRRVAQDGYIREVIASLGGKRAANKTVTVDNLKRAFALLDPAIDHIRMDRYIRWAFSDNGSDLNSISPIPLRTLAARLAAGDIERIGPKYRSTRKSHYK